MSLPVVLMEQEPAIEARPSRIRPKGIWTLCCLLLITSVINLIRFYQAVILWQFLKDTLPFTPLYLVLSGLIWGVLSLALAVLVWFGWAQSSHAVLLFFGIYSAYYWADRLFLPGYPEGMSNWPFVLSLNFFIIVWVFWLLNKPEMKRFLNQKVKSRAKSR